jgi:hypothetical protein
MSYKAKILFSFILISQCFLFGCQKEFKARQPRFNVKTAPDKHLTPRQVLGKKLFSDKTLSNPPGESCAACHDPSRPASDGNPPLFTDYTYDNLRGAKKPGKSFLSSAGFDDTYGWFCP